MKIDPRYQRWIDENAPKDARTARGRCGVETRAMCAAFPELRAAGGYYYGATERPSQHWWCIAPDGTIVDPTAIQFVDPTAIQFADRGAGCYEELAPEDHPRGKCMNCGNETFDKATCVPCEGSGTVVICTSPGWPDTASQEQQACSECRGAGQIPNAHAPTFCGTVCCRDFCLGTFGEFTHSDGRIEYGQRDEDG